MSIKNSYQRGEGGRGGGGRERRGGNSSKDIHSARMNEKFDVAYLDRRDVLAVMARLLASNRGEKLFKFVRNRVSQTPDRFPSLSLSPSLPFFLHKEL